MGELTMTKAEAKMWAVVNRDNVEQSGTRSFSLHTSIRRFLGLTYAPSDWVEAGKNGYRCVRVTVKED